MNVPPKELTEWLDAWDKLVLSRDIGGNRQENEEGANHEQLELQARQKKWSGNFNSDSECMFAFLKNPSLLTKEYNRQSQCFD